MRSPALQRTVIRARLRRPVREVAEHAAISAAASAREHLGPVVLASVSGTWPETDPKRLVVLLCISATKSWVIPPVFELTYWAILGSVLVCDGLLTGGLTPLTRGA